MNAIATNTDAAAGVDEATAQNSAAFISMLKHYSAQVRRDRRLSGAKVLSTTVHSPRLCGSQLTLDAVINAGRIHALGYRVRACSLGQATTAIVAERAIGMDAPELQAVQDQLIQILNGQMLDKSSLIWPELAIFQHAATMPSRHGSALLPFQALEDLFRKLPTNAYSNSEGVAQKEQEHG